MYFLYSIHSKLTVYLITYVFDTISAYLASILYSFYLHIITKYIKFNINYITLYFFFSRKDNDTASTSKSQESK